MSYFFRPGFKEISKEFTTMINNEQSYKYFDIPRHERDSVIAFLLNSLLHARAACRIPSNEKTFDEDVNIYMAHLLFANALPDYHDMTQRYLSLDAIGLMDLIESNPDKVVRYFIYKVNADYLFVHLGLFTDLKGAWRKPFRKSERQYIEMAQNYYDHASVFNHQIYRKKTAIGEVLEKLSTHFHDYLVILNSVRKDFFQVLNWMRSPQAAEGKENEPLNMKAFLEEKLNAFLDLYGEWLNTKSEELVPDLIRMVDDIRSIDPTFGFNLDTIQNKKVSESENGRLT